MRFGYARLGLAISRVFFAFKLNSRQFKLGVDDIMVALGFLQQQTEILAAGSVGHFVNPGVVDVEIGFGHIDFEREANHVFLMVGFEGFACAAFSGHCSSVVGLLCQSWSGAYD